MMKHEEWREWLARRARPLLPWVVRLSPNTWTLLALALALAAAACMAAAETRPFLYFAAAALAGLSGLLDALDGIVARATGTTSAWGDFLDHVCDRAADMAMIGGLALQGRASDRLGLAVMLLVLGHGYIGTQMEASFGRRSYAGAGRAEFLLLGIIICLALFLENRLQGVVSLDFAGRTWNIADLSLAFAAFSIAASMVSRLFRVWRAAPPQDLQKGRT